MTDRFLNILLGRTPIFAFFFLDEIFAVRLFHVFIYS